VRARTELRGPAAAAYLALDGGATVEGVRAALRHSGHEVPRAGVLESWLEVWVAERLALREGARYLGLAVNPAERVRRPAERFAALLAGVGSEAAAGA
jgi:hypothetical protein